MDKFYGWPEETLPISGAEAVADNTTTARDMLDEIDAFLSDGTVPERERQNLWNVLCAVRGPDKQYADDRKTNYNAPIRGAAFPQTAQSGLVPAQFAHPKTLNRSTLVEGGAGHYRRHMQRAASALGLI